MRVISGTRPARRLRPNHHATSATNATGTSSIGARTSPSQYSTSTPSHSDGNASHAHQRLRAIGASSSISASSASAIRSEEHTSELQSLMRISYAVFCLKKKTKKHQTHPIQQRNDIN